jgi:type IV pilus assembly protein PilV
MTRRDDSSLRTCGTAPAGRRRARGMSLLEVMVSVVVVSVGALSATSMQLLSKRNNWEAGQRLLATHLANTLAERLRADNSPDLLAAYVATAGTTVGLGRVRDALGESTVDAKLCPGTGSAASCCLEEDDACTPEQVARVALWQWEQMLDGSMEQNPDGVGSAGGLDRPTACVTAAGTPGAAGFYSVTIAFRGTLAMADNADVDCGRDAAFADGTKLYGDNNEYRRTLTVPAYIKPTVDK